MTERKVTLDLRYGQELIVIEDVPANACDNCGEQVFSPEVTRQVQKIARERLGATRTLTVPVFSLSEQATQ